MIIALVILLAVPRRRTRPTAKNLRRDELPTRDHPADGEAFSQRQTPSRISFNGAAPARARRGMESNLRKQFVKWLQRGRARAGAESKLETGESLKKISEQAPLSQGQPTGPVRVPCVQGPIEVPAGTTSTSADRRGFAGTGRTIQAANLVTSVFMPEHPSINSQPSATRAFTRRFSPSGVFSTISSKFNIFISFPFSHDSGHSLCQHSIGYRRSCSTSQF